MCKSVEFPDDDDNLLRMYHHFINQELLPEIQQLSTKYSVWWKFKNPSALKTYLREHDYLNSKYFTPDDILKVLKNIARDDNLNEPGNDKIIIPDSSLQTVFNCKILHLNDLTKKCLDHVDVASVEKTCQLKNKQMAKEFHVQSPMNIIYKDPSSLFWLHPIVNFMITKNKKITFNWKELLDLFIDFCTTNHFFFKQLNDCFIGINDNSPLSAIFSFKYFHISQCENILKSITKFLGRTARLNEACMYLHFNNYYKSKDSNILSFVDDVINNNNNITPFFDKKIYLYFSDKKKCRTQKIIAKNQQRMSA